MSKSCECGCGQLAPLAPATAPSRGWVKGQPLRFVHGHNARGRTGDSHPSWKGRDATYNSTHRYLLNHKPRTGTCEHCGARPDPYKGKTTGTDFANVSGNYLRQPDDYIELCRSCHTKLDNRRRTKSLL